MVLKQSSRKRAVVRSLFTRGVCLIARCHQEQYPGRGTAVNPFSFLRSCRINPAAGFMQMVGDVMLGGETENGWNRE